MKHTGRIVHDCCAPRPRGVSRDEVRDTRIPPCLVPSHEVRGGTRMPQARCLWRVPAACVHGHRLHRMHCPRAIPSPRHPLVPQPCPISEGRTLFGGGLRPLPTPTDRLAHRWPHDFHPLRPRSSLPHVHTTTPPGGGESRNEFSQAWPVHPWKPRRPRHDVVGDEGSLCGKGRSRSHDRTPNRTQFRPERRLSDRRPMCVLVQQMIDR